MSEKQKLILKFALDCLIIVLMCLSWVMRFPDGLFIVILCSSLISISQKLFFPKKLNPKKRERELTTAEVIAVFSITISAIYILAFTKAGNLVGNLLHNINFLIPMGIIAVAIRLLYFSKELAALQTSKPASS
jgi:hypothetical protein